LYSSVQVIHGTVFAVFNLSISTCKVSLRRISAFVLFLEQMKKIKKNLEIHKKHKNKNKKT